MVSETTTQVITDISIRYHEGRFNLCNPSEVAAVVDVNCPAGRISLNIDANPSYANVEWHDLVIEAIRYEANRITIIDTARDRRAAVVDWLVKNIDRVADAWQTNERNRLHRQIDEATERLKGLNKHLLSVCQNCGEEGCEMRVVQGRNLFNDWVCQACHEELSAEGYYTLTAGGFKAEGGAL